MAWAIITIYISKCAQMNPQQPPITSKFYSRCKKCDIEKTLGGGYHHPLVARRLTLLVPFARTKTLQNFAFSLMGLSFLNSSPRELHLPCHLDQRFSTSGTRTTGGTPDVAKWYA